MPARTKAEKITCEVYQSISPQVHAALAALQVDLAQAQPRRMLALRERAPFAFLPPTTRLEEDPAEVFEIYVPAGRARAALLALARGLRLLTPGRGAIYAEQVELVVPSGFSPCNEQLASAEGGERAEQRLARLALINCVVQRGHGNDIARRALEGGGCVPSVSFGIGTGIRNRLGLLRIAIPAEKEVVSLLVDAQDQDDALAALIDAGRLDQPGRGFVGAYPVPFGVLNPRSFRGRQAHGATMEQIIAAVDDLKAGAEWRRRSYADDGTPRGKRQWLEGLVNVTLNCNEGSADRLVEAAMAAGAGGATIGKAKCFSPTQGQFAALPARELIDLGIDPGKLPGLVDTLLERGAFEGDTACFLEIKPLPKAFTFVPA